VNPDVSHAQNDTMYVWIVSTEEQRQHNDCNGVLKGSHASRMAQLR